MTWKSYAAVSGATVLAGWLAAYPPANAPGDTPPAMTPGAAGTSGPSDIELEAARLQARVRREVEFRRPERNPFRFNAARTASRTAPSTVAPLPEIIDPVPPPVAVTPPFTLSGIAENQVGERTERTAILSSPAGVLLVKEGEQVGQFRVVRIEAEAVDLTRLDDGTTTRLSLRR